MLKKIARDTLEGIRKKGRPYKRWREGIEEDLNMMGIKNRQAMVRDSREGRKVALEAKVHNGL
jgi:hypothetical protein